MIRFRNQDLFANGNGTVQYLTKVDLEYVIKQLKEYDKEGNYLHITVVSSPSEELHNKMVDIEKLPNTPLEPLIGY